EVIQAMAKVQQYSFVCAPSVTQYAALACPVLLGPRSGSKTQSFSIPEGLAPGEVKPLVPLTVTRIESLRDGVSEPADGFTVTRWREDVASDLAPELTDAEGRGVVYAQGPVRYCAIWPDRALLALLVKRMAGEAGVALLDLPEGIRMRRTATRTFTFNYAAQPVFVPHLGGELDSASWHIAAREG
ncbi:MAG: beta-galactosidase, partial [Sphingomonadales bacterium]